MSVVFREPGRSRVPPASFWTPAELLAWPSAIVLTLSSFMGWYSGEIDGLSLSATGWQSGVLGKLVFFVGLAVLVLLVLRATGVELPPRIPVGVVIAGLGALATIFVLVRLLEVPDDYVELGRAIGLWISLAAALGLIGAGLLRASEEL